MFPPLPDRPSALARECGHQVQPEATEGGVTIDSRNRQAVGGSVADIDETAGVVSGHPDFNGWPAVPEPVGGELLNREQQTVQRFSADTLTA